MAEHSALTDPNLHEPKGIAAAAANKVYESDGAGSGSWKTNYRTYTLTVDLVDIAAPSSCYVVAPEAGTITKIYGTMDTSPNGDAIIQASIGGVNVTNGAVTIANGGTAGTAYTATPSAANTVTAGQTIKLTSDGGGSTTSKGTFSILITRSS